MSLNQIDENNHKQIVVTAPEARSAGWGSHVRNILLVSTALAVACLGMFVLGSMVFS